MKVQFEFGQYMARAIEGTSSSKGPMEEWVFSYAYLFPCEIETNIDDIFGMRKLLTLIPHLTSSFLEDLSLYKYEILLKALLKIMLPIPHGNLVCLNIFGWGVVTYVCLISFYFFNVAIETEYLTTFQLHPYIFLSLNVVCILRGKKVRCLKLFPSTWKGRDVRQSHQFVCDCFWG
jgi:hypothetical protein